VPVRQHRVQTKCLAWGHTAGASCTLIGWSFWYRTDDKGLHASTCIVTALLVVAGVNHTDDAIDCSNNTVPLIYKLPHFWHRGYLPTSYTDTEQQMRSPHYQKDKQLIENWTSVNISFQKGEIKDEEDIDDDTMGESSCWRRYRLRGGFFIKIWHPATFTSSAGESASAIGLTQKRTYQPNWTKRREKYNFSMTVLVAAEDLQHDIGPSAWYYQKMTCTTPTELSEEIFRLNCFKTLWHARERELY